MNKSIENLKIKSSIYLIDGNKFQPKMKINHKCIIGRKYFSKYCSIYFVKVHRDNYMKKLIGTSIWLEKQGGYGTRIHIDKINQYGLSQFHRNSFK